MSAFTFGLPSNAAAPKTEEEEVLGEIAEEHHALLEQATQRVEAQKLSEFTSSIHVATTSLLVVFTIVCTGLLLGGVFSENGKRGADGADGVQGVDGVPGSNGTAGSVGAAGANGPDGTGTHDGNFTTVDVSATGYSFNNKTAPFLTKSGSIVTMHAEDSVMMEFGTNSLDLQLEIYSDDTNDVFLRTAAGLFIVMSLEVVWFEGGFSVGSSDTVIKHCEHGVLPFMSTGPTNGAWPGYTYTTQVGDPEFTRLGHSAQLQFQEQTAVTCAASVVQFQLPTQLYPTDLVRAYGVVMQSGVREMGIYQIDETGLVTIGVDDGGAPGAFSAGSCNWYSGTLNYHTA